jgi:hypothetical protein
MRARKFPEELMQEKPIRQDLIQEDLIQKTMPDRRAVP